MDDDYIFVVSVGQVLVELLRINLHGVLIGFAELLLCVSSTAVKDQDVKGFWVTLLLHKNMRVNSCSFQNNFLL